MSLSLLARGPDNLPPLTACHVIVGTPASLETQMQPSTRSVLPRMRSSGWSNFSDVDQRVSMR